MAISNPFKTRPEADPGAELLATSATPLTIPEMLADSAARYGSKVAYQQKIGREWQRLTFDETLRAAREFGAGLIALGVQKGDRVVIIAENSLSWIVAYFGTSMAGAVGVPIYYELKHNEIEDLVRRSGAEVAVVSAKYIDHVQGSLPGVRRVIVVGGTEARVAKPSRFMRRARPDVIPFNDVPRQANDESRAELERRPVEPDDLASIVFTSGTTGGQKGVMLTHKNFLSNVESARRTMEVDHRDRIVLVLPMHHAFPFIIALANFAFGGELTFENDLVRVRDRLRETKPTLFLGVPALFEQMYRAIVRRAEIEGRRELFERGLRVVDVAKRRTGVNLGRFVFREVHQQLGGHLRFALSGAAALNPEVARNFFRLGLPLLQGWGMSEAAPIISTQRWNPRKFLFSNYYEEHLGSVGEPIEGVEVELIDVPEKNTYVRLHGEGELVVRGPNVFAGYWQAEEETRAAKIGEWLRTGDMGRIDEEGNIWITGRCKYVIVLESGEKVVPDELEERFQLSDVIQDVCVVPREQRGKTTLGAVVFPALEGVRKRIEGDLTEEAVRRVVEDEIGEMSKTFVAQYKRVGEVILSDTPLPKTAIMKVHRARLPEQFTFDVQRWEEQARVAGLPPGEGESAGGSDDESE